MIVSLLSMIFYGSDHGDQEKMGFIDTVPMSSCSNPKNENELYVNYNCPTGCNFKDGFIIMNLGMCAINMNL